MKTKEFLAGVKDTLPIMVGVFPFGLAYGIVAQSIGLTSGETLLMSLLVFAGAAQFISLPMFAEGAGMAMIALTALLINLRHLLMGMSLAPYMNGLSMPQKAFLSFGMVDESYAVTISRVQAIGYSAAYQLGSNMICYVTWVVSTIGGILLGSRISNPLSWGLDFAMPATFLALLIPRLTDKRNLMVCLIAAGVSIVAAVTIPGKWYIIIACLTAAVAGGILEGAENDEN
ncbi:Inner membrane protein YgaZ [bioreactor metagenome]|uniref:Inner membrane protein YgaZ n=1 Tax=bioreactor metagenome TaxID=1076179 RepID=A0A644SUV8_9ZZZZ|nr:AzlC family ABC transporter permease [Negativicutes bacterium]